MIGLKPLILIVEDNCLIARAAQLSLSKHNALVHVVDNGEQAVEACRLRHYSLIFMDVEMPLLNGIQAALKIREEERAMGRHTPIIGVTANDFQQLCLESGMDQAFKKPVDYGRLLESWLLQLRGVKAS